MNAIIRVDGPASGQHNMDVDEALLRDAQNAGALLLRVYRWQKPTLSLGHFQNESEIPDDAPWGHIERVRRKTGGGAIVHDVELTYSLVIPHNRKPDSGAQSETPVGAPSVDFGKKGPSDLIYRSVHNELVVGLQRLGLPAKLAEQCTCKTGEDGKGASFLCFERRSPVDIVIDGYKVVGSAQRRTQHGLLQHGSVLLRTSEFARHLCGIQDLLDARGPGFQGKTNDLETGGRLPLQVEGPPLDWGSWTEWLLQILQRSVNNAFLGYWRFEKSVYTVDR
ncbi:lipoyl protein ligase domain-containing protein [Pirellulaceae bacterium SH449]